MQIYYFKPETKIHAHSLGQIIRCLVKKMPGDVKSAMINRDFKNQKICCKSSFLTLPLVFEFHLHLPLFLSSYSIPPFPGSLKKQGLGFGFSTYPSMDTVIDKTSFLMGLDLDDDQIKFGVLFFESLFLSSTDFLLASGSF